MRYIDSEKLIAEIDRLGDVLNDPICQRDALGPDWVNGGKKMLKEIRSYIESLQQEQPEVDLERDAVSYCYDNGINISPRQAKGIARHFYELGLAARKDQSDNWNDEYREDELQIRFAFYTYKDEDGVLYLSNVFVEETSRNKGFGTKILQVAENVAETIGAITIRLKVKQNSPANDWYRKHGYGYLTFEDGYDWLEKNLEYLKPKQEQPEVDLDAIVDEAFDKYSSVDGYGQLAASFNRAELYSFIKKIARKLI